MRYSDDIEPITTVEYAQIDILCKKTKGWLNILKRERRGDSR